MQNRENALALIKRKIAVNVPVPLGEEIKVYVENLLTNNPYLSKDVMRMIQGDYRWHKKSDMKQLIDKIIVDSLLHAGVNKRFIKYIFRVYPTTGLYGSRPKPDEYLETIIKHKIKWMGMTEEELRNPLFASKSIANEKGVLKLDLYWFQIHLRQQHFVRQGTETKIIYLFNGKTYEPINDDSLNELCQVILGEYRYLFAASAITKIRGYLVGDKEAKINEAADLNLIALNNGVFDTDTQDVREYSPNLFIRNIHQFDFDEFATCSIFHQFLDATFMGNQSAIQLLQEVIGYSLYRGMPIPTLFLLVGPDRISKSVLLEVLAALHGIDNVVNIRIAKLAQDKSHQQLLGKTVNIVNEYSFPRNLQADTLIKVTSGDSVTGRIPGEKSVTFKPYAKHFVATNEIPDFGDNSYEMMRRTYQIRFPRAFCPEDEDLSLADRLIEELPGIFNWAIKGLQQLQQKQRPFTFSYTAAMASDMKAAYHEGNETVAFLESYLDRTDNPEKFVPYTETKNLYKEAMLKQRQKPIGEKKFKALIESMGFVVTQGNQNKSVIRFATPVKKLES